FDLVKNEVDRAVGANGAQYVAVGFLAALFGPGSGGGKAVTHGACRAHDPSRQHAAVPAPVVAIENPAHVEMRVAGEDVNVLARLLAEVQQGGVDAVPALGAYRGVAHAVAGSQAVRQGGVHAHHNRRHVGIGGGARENSLEPANLIVVELIRRGVVE